MSVRVGHSNDRQGFLTISADFLSVDELAEGEEGASWPHPSPGDLLEGAKGEYEKSNCNRLHQGIPAVTCMPREVHEDRQWSY